MLKKKQSKSSRLWKVDYFYLINQIIIFLIIASNQLVTFKNHTEENIRKLKWKHDSLQTSTLCFKYY